MALTPRGVGIGQRWTPKRGRRELGDVRIVNLYRADRSALVELEDGSRKCMKWTDLRRDWNLAEWRVSLAPRRSR